MSTELTTQDRNVLQIQNMMAKMKDQIQAALPRHMTPDRMLRIALTELRKVPKLSSCDPLSFMGAIVQCSQLGLEPGSGLGHAYLIPFFNSKKNITECNFIPGYRGLIELARRSGQIDSISARVVYEKDNFAFRYGDDEHIEHIPYAGKDAGPITHAYAIARIKGASQPQREVMTRDQLEEIRRKHGKTNPVWADHFDEMARKTVVRRLCKYLPQSPEMALALAADDKAETGQSNWAVIDQTYIPEQVKVDVVKGREVRESADLDAMDEARALFDVAVEQAQERGVDIEKALKVTEEQVKAWKDPKQYETAAKLLDAMKK